MKSLPTSGLFVVAVESALSTFKYLVEDDGQRQTILLGPLGDSIHFVQGGVSPQHFAHAITVKGRHSLLDALLGQLNG